MRGHAPRGSSNSESAEKMGDNGVPGVGGISGSSGNLGVTGALGVGGISTGRTRREELQTGIGLSISRNKGLFRRRVLVAVDGTAAISSVFVVSFGQSDS